MNNTDTIISGISEHKLTQPAIAVLCAKMMIRDGVDSIDWKLVNAEIVKRWSSSGRERVLTMTWKIIEQTKRAKELGQA
jgi:hypothetical protein